MEESPADYVKENTRLADPADGEKIMQIVRQISFLSKFPVSILSESFIPNTENCETFWKSTFNYVSQKIQFKFHCSTDYEIWGF